ncbi:hypothetical protein [Anaerotignum sp.]|uniref:hypothetical protein n=1 Tax=Anaerotignum sp. TaxID=2039241 RepID=UPI003318EC2B
MKHKMSKGWIVAVCLGLALAFTGCGNSNETPSDAPAQEEVQDVQPEEQGAVTNDQAGVTDTTTDAATDTTTDAAPEASVDGEATAE